MHLRCCCNDIHAFTLFRCCDMGGCGRSWVLVGMNCIGWIFQTRDACANVHSGCWRLRWQETDQTRQGAHINSGCEEGVAGEKSGRGGGGSRLHACRCVFVCACRKDIIQGLDAQRYWIGFCSVLEHVQGKTQSWGRTRCDDFRDD
jgi:hypothetical protein